MRPAVAHRCLASALALALAACSGSSAPEGTEPTVAPATTASGLAPATTPSAVTTVPAATTSTAAPLAAVPLGVRWEAGPVLATSALGDTRGHRFVTVGGATWYLAARYNGAAIHRSIDGGATWAAVDPGAPTPGETLRVIDLAEGPAGRLVALAARGTRCAAGIDVGDGYQSVGFCQRQAAAILLSDDDGATWRRVDPPSMAPPGDASVRPASLVATAAGFVVAGTVAGPDWHPRLWSSPDGENWTLDLEVRGASPFASAEQLLTDGTALVLLVSEHPCSSPRISTPGWVLGADWVDWPRVYSGSSVADLAPLAPADHPFVRELDVSTCDVLGTLPGVSAVDDTHPGMSGLVVGGAVTLLEDPRPTPADIAAEAADDDEAEATSGRRRLSQLVDGRWTLVEIDGVQSESRRGAAQGSGLIDVDGTPGIFETSGSSRTAETTPAPILPVGDGTWVQRVPEHSILGREIVASAWLEGALVAVASTPADPWADTLVASDPATFAVWTSRETSGPRRPCELGPGVVCLFADLTQSPGYPDFAGLDLTGADLAYAQFGDADVSGATFDGARLWGVRSGSGSSADGATFRGARAQGAQLRSTVGADFTGADVSSSSLYDATGAVFTGAVVRSASITMELGSLANLAGVPLVRARITVVPPAVGPFEVSLAGFDLTGANIGAEHDGPLLRVISLDGAVLAGAALRRVDLTAIDPAVVDLSDLDVWDEASRCPDGLPPDDLPIGTCTRAPAGS